MGDRDENDDDVTTLVLNLVYSIGGALVLVDALFSKLPAVVLADTVVLRGMFGVPVGAQPRELHELVRRAVRNVINSVYAWDETH